MSVPGKYLVYQHATFFMSRRIASKMSPPNYVHLNSVGFDIDEDRRCNKMPGTHDVLSQEHVSAEI